MSPLHTSLMRLLPSLPRKVGRVAFTFFAVPIATTIFLNDNVVELTWITGSSMSPTLSPDFHATGASDWVLWRKWNPTHDVKRGDVVHFDNPVDPRARAVKRVIGVEGDTVLLDPRRRPARERDGADVPESRGWDAWRGSARVPEGHVWVEGDNWRKSRDSNYYGPISKSLITGRAVAVVLPWEKFRQTPWDGFVSRTKVVPGKVKSRRELEDVALERAG